jgi:hypothetical protein
MPGAGAIVVVEVSGAGAAGLTAAGVLTGGGATAGVPEASAAAPSWTVGT